MCSLVNAKSGGCAEDCGFCAQSRFAEADTPMHAMMTPEQILEHAQAAEAAGAHRFCMVTQGQGLSKRDFQNILEGARLVAEHTNLKRCASIGHMSVERARQLKDAGIQRVHHNVETAESYYPEVSTTVRYEGRLPHDRGGQGGRARDLRRRHPQPRRDARAARRDGLPAGGDQPHQRAHQPAQPAPGHEVRRPRLMDPWEAVKWIAIFRLILPEALFRLCGGRVENLGDLQPLAVKAGLNGVMMGNFLTTLGPSPRTTARCSRSSGLNVARQPDNGANPRPDNRSGWLDGEAPGRRSTSSSTRRTTRQLLGGPCAPPQDLRAAQARRRAEHPRGGAGESGGGMSTNEIEERLDDIRARGLYRKMRCVSGPQGPRVLLDGRPVLLLCSNNYLGLADHPRVREAAAEAAMRYGAGAGASRLISGNMTIHRRLEEQLADFKGAEACLLFGSGYLANGVVSALAREGDVVFSDALNHASIIDGCRLARAETFVYDHCDLDHLAWGLRGRGRGALIVTDGVFSMDGDVAPLPEIVELAQRYDARVMVDEAHGTGCVGPGGRGAVADAGLEDEVDVIVGTLGKALGSYGAYVLCDKPMAKYLINTARTFIFSTAPPPPAVAAAMAALELLREQPRRVEKLQRNAAVLREALTERGMPVEAGETPIVPLIVGDADAAMAVCERALERGVFAQAIRPPTVPAGTSRLRLAVMASHTSPSCARRRGCSPRRCGKARASAVATVDRPAVFDGLADAA